jgi:hypothetical protein
MAFSTGESTSTRKQIKNPHTLTAIDAICQSWATEPIPETTEMDAGLHDLNALGIYSARRLSLAVNAANDAKIQTARMRLTSEVDSRNFDLIEILPDCAARCTGSRAKYAGPHKTRYIQSDAFLHGQLSLKSTYHRAILS